MIKQTQYRPVVWTKRDSRHGGNHGLTANPEVFTNDLFAVREGCALFWKIGAEARGVNPAELKDIKWLDYAKGRISEMIDRNPVSAIKMLRAILGSQEIGLESLNETEFYEIVDGLSGEYSYDYRKWILGEKETVSE